MEEGGEVGGGGFDCLYLAMKGNVFELRVADEMWRFHSLQLPQLSLSLARSCGVARFELPQLRARDGAQGGVLIALIVQLISCLKNNGENPEHP